MHLLNAELLTALLLLKLFLYMPTGGYLFSSWTAGMSVHFVIVVRGIGMWQVISEMFLPQMDRVKKRHKAETERVDHEGSMNK